MNWFEVDGDSRLVRVPWFPPTYSGLRHLLRIWSGYSESQIKGLHQALVRLRGTPQNPVDWRNPDKWIADRLTGINRQLAQAIWAESEKTVNPRYTDGHWILSRTYGLLAANESGQLRLTDRGSDFVDHELGSTEALLDKQEGIVELLTIVADFGPAAFGAIVDSWANFLNQHSNYSSQSTIRDTLRRRLRNALERGLVERERQRYSITDYGRIYLERVAPVSGRSELREIQSLSKKLETAVRDQLLDYILNLDADALERLVGRVLEEMDYQNVEVIGQIGDGGVDVVADIEMGITSVREVVQVKRHQRNVQRKDLDALRGSLYRFDAVRGTLVTTSGFARGTKDAAIAKGAPPITLIDGERFIDLLVDHDIGVRKHSIEVISIDLQGLEHE